MSYARTPELPREHPLAKLIERSTRAHKLPSCEGCKLGEPLNFYAIPKPDAFVVSCGKVAATFEPTHFCAAWEPRT